VLLLKLIIIVVGAVALVAGTRELLRRKLSTTSLQNAEKAIPFLLGSISGFYGLIAGFMLSNSYAELRLLQGAMTSEINALAQLARITQHMPQPVSGELRHGIDVYVESVLNSELPLMRKGHLSTTAGNSIDRLWRVIGNSRTTRSFDELWTVLGRYRPASDWDTSLRNLSLNTIVEIGEQRRRRLLAASQRMPPLILWILIGGGIVVVSGAAVASLQYRRPADLFLGALTAIVALVLFVIVALQEPFRYGVTSGTAEFALLRQGLKSMSVEGPDTSATPPAPAAPAR
jgi:hypothetical protein